MIENSALSAAKEAFEKWMKRKHLWGKDSLKTWHLSRLPPRCGICVLGWQLKKSALSRNGSLVYQWMIRECIQYLSFLSFNRFIFNNPNIFGPHRTVYEWKEWKRRSNVKNEARKMNFERWRHEVIKSGAIKLLSPTLDLTFPLKFGRYSQSLLDFRQIKDVKCNLTQRKPLENYHFKEARTILF